MIDGDTLHLDNGDKLRLVGINTPEIGRGGAASEPLAEQARAALVDLVGADRVVRVTDARVARDRHGRRLAHLYDRDGGSVVAQLLAGGWGFHVAVAPNFTHLECFQAAEEEARSAGRGVWSEPGLAVQQVHQLVPGEGGFTRVVGTVTRVSFKENGWWIQLDGKVGLRIRGEDQARFDRARLRAAQGEHLQARGWLVPMRGDWWLMDVSHPAMLAWGRGVR